MKVAFDQSPLHNQNSIRGVGVYTRFLLKELEKIQDQHFTLTNNIENADLIHYPFFDLFFPTLPFSILNRQKRVVTIHDVIPLLFPEHYPVGLKGKVHFFRQILGLRSVDAIVTDSYASKSDIVKYLEIPEQKVFVVYLAGNPEIINVSKEIQLKVRKKYQLPEKYILYVGDINYNKNLPSLIQSLQYVPKEISLVCVGKNFKPQEIPEWRAIENELVNFKERVLFINSIQKDDLKDLSAIYSAAELYVQPSLAEGFGLPVLEAMQTETLVVCARNSSLIEVGGEVVEFIETDSNSIAEGINKVLKMNGEKKRQRKKEALEWARQFSWNKSAEETVAVYHKLFAEQSI